MLYKRIHIRIPVIGEATLSCSDGAIIKARTIDISAGGLRIANPTSSLENVEYDVEVVIADHGKVTFKAVYVHGGEQGIGLKIVKIDPENLKAIYQKITAFQATEEFINLIDEHDILQDWFRDENGANFEVTFEVES
jgi:hypothetical protein